MLQFFQTEKKIEMKDIEQVEKLVNLKFPLAYKLHLLEYNGGRCIPNVFYFIEEGKKTSSSIDWFLAVYDGEYDNLSFYINIYKINKKRMPETVIPIANDGLGNSICLDTFDGKVYFWDHEKEVNYSMCDDSIRWNMYLIANSFEEFLTKLKDE